MVDADAHGFKWRWQVEASRNHSALNIKKYPNRRYYDATRSRHVTLQEVHQLVRGGHDVTIVDSRSGADITNVVLAQLILDKEVTRVSIFPTELLHAIIRADDDALARTGEHFAQPLIAALRNGAIPPYGKHPKDAAGHADKAGDDRPGDASQTHGGTSTWHREGGDFVPPEAMSNDAGRDWNAAGGANA